jgi:hypothetical protein
VVVVVALVRARTGDREVWLGAGSSRKVAFCSSVFYVKHHLSQRQLVYSIVKHFNNDKKICVTESSFRIKQKPLLPNLLLSVKSTEGKVR